MNLLSTEDIGVVHDELWWGYIANLKVQIEGAG